MNSLHEAVELAIRILRTDIPDKNEVAVKILEVATKTQAVSQHIDSYLDELPAKIKRARFDLKMSQAQFAKYIGVSQALVGQWERGEVRPSFKTVKLLAKVLS